MDPFEFWTSPLHLFLSRNGFSISSKRSPAFISPPAAISNSPNAAISHAGFSFQTLPLPISIPESHPGSSLRPVNERPYEKAQREIVAGRQNDVKLTSMKTLPKMEISDALET